MSVIPIRCPKCHSGFKLKVPNASALQGKLFACPKCGFSVPFPVLLNHAATDDPNLHTHIANSGNVGGKTQVATGKTTIAQQGVYALPNILIEVEKSQEKFRLHLGQYVLGRRSPDSKATLMLTPDPYMSRQNALLTVMVNGGQLRCVLQAYQNTNPVFVNQKQLSPMVQQPLKNGDRIQMGMTMMTFIIK